MSFQERSHMWKLAGKYSALGLEMGISLALGTWGGSWIDRHFGTQPWGMGFGFVVGVGAAVNGVLRAVRQARRELH